MFGVLSVTFNPEKCRFDRQFVRLPNRHPVLFDTDAEAREFAASMNKHLTDSGIVSTKYRARNYSGGK